MAVHRESEDESRRQLHKKEKSERYDGTTEIEPCYLGHLQGTSWRIVRIPVVSKLLSTAIVCASNGKIFRFRICSSQWSWKFKTINLAWQATGKVSVKSDGVERMVPLTTMAMLEAWPAPQRLNGRRSFS